MRGDVTAGRLDSDAVNAVLRAAGLRALARRSGIAGLTAREIEVLILIARGHPNKEIARRLSVTPKTVSNHIEHVYAKLGVASRAAATLYATQHGLLSHAEWKNSLAMLLIEQHHMPQEAVFVRAEPGQGGLPGAAVGRGLPG